jgi:hypothetical protein
LLRVYLLLQSRELVAVETCLQIHCLTTDVFSDSAVLALSGHVTIFCLMKIRKCIH